MARDKLKSSDLAKVLSDPLVIKCVWWKDIGLALQLEKHIVDRIGQDYHGQTEDCKREVIDWWLRNGDHPTWQKLHNAITKANSWHDSPGEEGKQAAEAVDTIENFLANWDEVNMIVVYKHERLECELKNEEVWVSDIKSPDEDYSEWKQSEDGIKREKIKQALSLGHNYLASNFVQTFLRNKGISNFSRFNDTAIEGMLRQALLDIDVERSRRIMTPQFEVVKEHKKDLEGLQNKIIELREQLTERLVAYKKLKRFLENAKVSKDEVQKVNDRMKIIDNAIERCERVKIKCDQLHGTVHSNFQYREQELNDFIQCLIEAIKLMEKLDPHFESSMLQSAAAGATVGAVLGTFALPIIGTVIGAAIGAGIGAIAGASNRREEAEREIRMFKDTMKRGQTERSRITTLLNS